MRSWVRGVSWFLLFLAVLLPAAFLFTPRTGETVPLYAARNGLLCQTCHFDPNGGGPRNEFGFAFARNRHKLTPEDSSSHWANLQVGNRVGESMPLYVGVNQRFMLFANGETNGIGLARLGFFNMENEIHLAFQPHDMLTLVYTIDGFAPVPQNTVRSKEAFGLIGGQGKGGYIKVGRFRNPFGLRMDDHTVATRGQLSEFGVGGTFLPYDPRLPDMGIELGGDVNGWYARVAALNGETNVLSGLPQTMNSVSTKFGYNNSWYQGAMSLATQNGSSGVRSDRWAYALLTHVGDLAAIGEIGFGTDTSPFVVGKFNSMAYFGELDYAPTRWSNVRVRYDRQELDRGHGTLAADASTFQRYALEAEVVPVPFAELRGSFRLIDSKDVTVPTERQAFLQFHFSY